MRLQNNFIRPMGLAVAMAFGLTVAAGSVVAADKKAKGKAGDRHSWVKICETVKVKDVKTKKDSKKKICMTHHEKLSARSGASIFAAAVRKVEGHKTERFLVTVPLNRAIPAGVLLKIDDKKPIPFKYSFCHIGGCVAETEMTADLLKSMKSGKNMIVATMDIGGKQVPFHVPLKGFAKIHSGKAVIDGKKYATDRRKMMMAIRKRAVELAKQQKLKEADKPGGKK